MQEIVKSATTVCKSGLLALFIVLPLTWVSSIQAAAVSKAEYAIQSSRAERSLLLGITNAGERLVTVGERGHILYSDDQGLNWQQAQVPTRQLLTAVYFINERLGWAVGHDAIILHTEDGGQSWHKQYSDPELEAPLLDIWFADEYNGFAVGAYGTLLATDDAGQSWQDFADELDNEDGFHLNAITEIPEAGLFIVGEMGVMFRSLDQGQSWESVASPYEGSLFGLLPTGSPAGVIVYGLRGHVFLSNDFGDNWQELELTTTSGNKLEFGLADGAKLANGDLLIVGHGGTVLRSTDQGHSFQVSNRSDRISLAGIAAVKDGLLLIGQGGIHLTPDSGLNSQR